MLNFPEIRLLHVGQWNGGRGGHPVTPHSPQSDIQPYPNAPHPSLNWTTPCTNMSDAESCRKQFSAVCWMMGRALFKALDPPRPIGLMQATWGGTGATLWSSPKALAQCGEYDASADHSPMTTLWNSAVVPLLRTTIRTIVWCKSVEQNTALSCYAVLRCAVLCFHAFRVFPLRLTQTPLSDRTQIKESRMLPALAVRPVPLSTR